MVKPDLKHNYYQDLDLPTTASVDDVRKAYRKLALQYHPDRNAGREEECVPRFQAIQAANEILSDPTSKAKYDADRRKVGLYPSFGRTSAPGPTGNPYAARSDFPPPPRRTQPGTWHRPGGPTTPGPQPTGADRFTNFPRPGGATPQKNPAADRTQQFRAWQNMKEPNTAHRPQPPEVPSRPQAQPRPPQPPTPGAAPTSARPQASNGKYTNMEERIKAGMRHGTTPSAEDAARNQSAWQSFQKSNAGQPGLSSNGQRRQPPATPKRPGGFDPNAPGSDERAAPQSSHYVHRHKSEDFGSNGFPPPPPGPPPASSAHSPTSPDAQRPFADPLRPFRTRPSNEDAPYAEGNRTSTPYSSYIGEKTAFNAAGLARSASVRDTAKLSPQSAKSSSSTRARSVDPATRRKQASSGSPTNPSRGNGFAAGMYSESNSASESSDDEDVIETPEEIPMSGQPSTTSSNNAQHGGPAGMKRTIKTPKPPSRFFPNRNGASNRYPEQSNDGAAHTDGEQPSMQERKKTENMYEVPFTQRASNHSSFSRGTWVTNQFGTGKAKDGKPSKASVPFWAIPSSVSPATNQSSTHATPNGNRSSTTPIHPKRGPPVSHSSEDRISDDELALRAFRAEFRKRYGNVEQLNQLDMTMFQKAVAIVRSGQSTGDREFDLCLCEVLARSSLGSATSPQKLADKAIPNHSFSFPIDHETFTQTKGKSRSVEEINTNFSPGGFHGKFEGSGDYFATEEARRPSPAQRQSSRRSQRAATMDSTPVSNGPSPMPPPRPTGSDTSQPGSNGPFSPEAWQKTFSDGGTFAWPPPPPNPPASKAPSRKSSRVTRANGNGSTLGTAQHPHVVDDDDNVIELDSTGRPVNGAGPPDDGDAMDIDTPPQADRTLPTEQAAPSAKEARLYSVPPSEWRQQQASQQPQNLRHTSSSTRRAERKSAGESSFNVNLDDLRHTEPFVRNNDGLKDLGELGSSLPFASKASSTLPTQMPRSMSYLQQSTPLPKIPESPTKLTRTSWETYYQKFANYLVAFHIWNKTYLQHFATCEREAEDRIKNGCGWLAQSGDTADGMGGFGSYLRSLKDENQACETYGVGRDRHLEAVEKFDKVRERVRALTETGTLADV